MYAIALPRIQCLEDGVWPMDDSEPSSLLGLADLKEWIRLQIQAQIHGKDKEWYYKQILFETIHFH